jgi:hypothetical protein
MIKLVIDGKEADVLQTESIVGEYAVAPIGDISKRVGARSIQFKLPKTAKNKAIFESGEIPTSTSNKPYTNLSCRIYVDGVDMNMVFCQLETVDDNYNIRMYGGNSTLFADLKNKKLADLDLNHLNHHWNVDHIAVSKGKDYPLKYPLIDYNADSPNNAIDESDSSIYMACLMPVLYQHYLIEQCIEQSGYTLNNETKDALMFKNIVPVTPLGSSGYERDKNPNKYFGTFMATSVFLDTVIWLNTAQREVYYLNDPFRSILFQDNVRIKVRGNIRAKVTTLDPIFGTHPLHIVFEHSDDGTTVVQLDIVNTVLTDTNFHDYPFDFDVTVTKEFLGFYRQLITPAYILTDFYDIDLTACSVEIYECEVLKNWELRYGQTIDFPYNEYVTVANNLPDFSQADFIKQYLMSTNSITTVDERNKVVTIVPYKKILDNITNAIDWTGKIDFTNRPKTEFKLDYAQHNYLRYKDDDSVIKPDGTDYDLTIVDERLEYEKKLIELLYSATESVYRCNKDMAKINCFEEYLYKYTFTPRSLFLRFEDFTFRYRPNKTDAIDAVTITTDVPIGYFIDDNQEYSNGFGKNLFENFFTFIIGIITKTKVIEVDMRLTISDIANFDPLFPVYIGEFDAHFYVNKIKFDYTKRNSSVVELVKLL